MNFYASIFKNSKIGGVSRYPEGGPGPAGRVMTATLELEGQEFMVLNGGPKFKFTEAISFFVNCETQEEVDELWGKLSAGGKEGQCGLAERQIWIVLADRSLCFGQDARR